MNDLISRQAAIDALEGYIDDKGIFNQDRWFVHGIKTAITHLMGMPSTEPEPKTGEWNFDGNQMYECTNCGVAYTEYQFEKMRVRYDDPKFPKFCPDCGSYNGGDSDVEQ